MEEKFVPMDGYENFKTSRLSNLPQAEKLKSMEKRFTPGPGAYDVNSFPTKEIIKQSQFSSREYPKSSKQLEALDPGRYVPENFNWSKGR